MAKKSRHVKGDGGGLSPRQQAFVTLYGSGKFTTATDAAVAAGYSRSSARAQSYDLLRHPLIKAELDKIAATVRDKTAFTAVEAFRETVRLRDAAEKDDQYSAAAKLNEQCLKLSGLLIDRQQIAVESTVDISGALADARARVTAINPSRAFLRPAGDPTSPPLLPIRCQDEPIDAECIEVSRT